MNIEPGWLENQKSRLNSDFGPEKKTPETMLGPRTKFPNLIYNAKCLPATPPKPQMLHSPLLTRIPDMGLRWSDKFIKNIIFP